MASRLRQRLPILAWLLCCEIGFAVLASHVIAQEPSRAQSTAVQRQPTKIPTTGSVRGTVRVLAEDGEQNETRKATTPVVVYLEGVPGALENVASGPFRIAQEDEQFSPALLVVPRGSRVEFPNGDKVFHNVFSLSRASRFDLGLYKSGSSKSVTMRRAGVVDVYCNIHPQMVAKVLVLDTKHYARVDADGNFFIDKVPPGTYPVVGWQPFGPEFRGEVIVQAQRMASVSVTLRPGIKKKRRHLRKDGTPYDRYK